MSFNYEKMASASPEYLKFIEEASPELYTKFLHTKALKEAMALKPIPEGQPMQSTAVQVLPANKKPDVSSGDASSEASTELNSEITELDAMSVVSEAECTCKYYTVKNNIIYDTQGNQQTQKWAKRMRQKERDEKTTSRPSSSSGTATSKDTSKAVEWLEGGKTQAGGEVQGAMAIAAPEAKPKAAGGEVQGAMAIAAPEDKPKDTVYVPKTGCNKAKPLTAKPYVGKRIETWPLVPCATSDCDTVKRWNQMYEERTVLHQGSGVFDDDDYVDEVKYFCNVCMAFKWEMTPQEAQAKIISERPGFQTRIKANKRFTDADAKTAEDLPAMSKGERRLITISQMQEVIAPFASFWI